MSKELDALEKIKQAPTIYVGCYSDIYTRNHFECKIIENALKVLDIIKNHRTHIAWGVFLNDLPEDEYQLVRKVFKDEN